MKQKPITQVDCKLKGRSSILRQECCDLYQYCPGDKIEKNEMDGTCSTQGDRRGVFRVLVVKPEVKRPLGRPRLRWEDNIKMDFQKVGCGSIELIELDQNREL
jgi:hypothetical protein